MKKQAKENERKSLSYLLIGAVVYIVLPLSYVLLGDFPSRTVLKESLSLLTIGSFFLMLGQFYLSRINKATLKKTTMAKVNKTHKIIGYIFIPVLFLHPFFIVLPRFFESGVAPMEAFQTMLTTFGSKGIILGIVAMVLMILLGLTSMLRKKMPLHYKTWRVSHGLLSIAFVILATWHAVDLGRHTDLILSTYMIIMAAIGILLLLSVYLVKPQSQGAAK
jgi:predicted ferric reductase